MFSICFTALIYNFKKNEKCIKFNIQNFKYLNITTNIKSKLFTLG